MTTLLMLRAGYGYVPYASLERIIEDNKEFYYKALRRTQSTLKKERPDWEPWIGFFLRCLKKQKDKLAAVLKQERSPHSDLPELSLKVLESLQSNKRLTASEIVELTGANPNTIKLRLRELVNSGRIQRQGKGRATWYTL